jgi:hypothetical protein
MSKKFIIFVIDDSSNSGTPAEMEAIDSFNNQLRENGHWIFAWGLEAPSTANVIDNRDGAGIETGKPLFGAAENFSGFWLIEAADADVAKELAYAGSKACNRKVELRPLHS